MARSEYLTANRERSPAGRDSYNPAVAVFETSEWPDSLFRSDGVCPLPHNTVGQRRHVFTDWADL